MAFVFKFLRRNMSSVILYITLLPRSGHNDGWTNTSQLAFDGPRIFGCACGLVALSFFILSPYNQIMDSLTAGDKETVHLAMCRQVLDDGCASFRDRKEVPIDQGA